MPYSVVQLGLESPSTEQLSQAFAQVPGLTAFDARALGRDACGVLVKGFELARANQLQAALAAQNIAAEVVDDADLSDLPAPAELHKVEFTPEALLIYDLLGRSVPLEWKTISIIAAGRARLTEFTTTMEPKMVARSGRDSAPTIVLTRQTKEQQADHLLLEVITRQAARRYHVVADQPETLLLFQCLGERRTRDPLANLMLFVQEAKNHAPQALLNHGAQNFCGDCDPTLIYASKTAFYREITWLLWMISQGRAQP